MPNTFITLKLIARQALPRLIENLVFPNLVYRDFSNDFQDMGDTIQVRRPSVLEAKEFDATEGVDYQDMKESSVDVKLDKIATVDAKASAIETAVNISDLNSIFIEPAAVALAEKINSDGLALYADIPYAVGTAGTTPSSLDAIAAVREMLNVNKVPVAGRKAVWDPKADAKFTAIPAIVNAEKSGTTAALREGSIGRIFGLDNYMAQGIKKHVAGTLVAGGTSPKITVKTAVTAAANKVTLDATASANPTLSGTLKKGDILVISGKQYVITADATADANEVEASIYPAIVVAADVEVTLLAGHTANLAFNPMAFAYVTRPLINPDGEGVASYVTSFNGISLRVTRGYNQQFKRSTYSMDVLYGYKTLYPELAVRALG